MRHYTACAEMNVDSRIHIPPAWERITLSALNGTVLVVGAPDTGKSTFARYLYRRLCTCRERVAFVDGDVGQATLGPPTTMTLALGCPGDDAFPPAGPCSRAFVGDISPRGHMLPMLVGAHKLVQKARVAGASAIIFDTTGLVDLAYGGAALKQAKIELLAPSAVVGIQRGNELEHLLVPFRHSRRTRVIDLPASWAAQRRGVTARREHRATGFRRYFEGARELDVAWQRLAVFPAPAFSPGRLVALEDDAGLALGLGIVVASDLARSTSSPRLRTRGPRSEQAGQARGTVTLHTPLSSLTGVDAIRLGDLALDPHTFRESHL